MLGEIWYDYVALGVFVGTIYLFGAGIPALARRLRKR